MLNGILVIDKPEGITSHGVVSRLRRILGERRIGHGGTLDPMATGVLPVFIGRATRASDLLLSANKSYTARFRLGITTDTQDITGSILTECDTLPSAGELAAILCTFTGRIKQIPPMYSAIKVDGKKLYEIARSGGEIERAPREIEIYALDLLQGDNKDEYAISVVCSKGTYIRTLVHDIGGALGCGATLTALRRTSTGIFDLTMAKTLDEIALAASAESVSEALIPVDSLFREYPKIEIDADGEQLCRHGALIPIDMENADRLYRVYGPGNHFLMIAKSDTVNEKTVLKTVKNFFDVG